MVKRRYPALLAVLTAIPLAAIRPTPAHADPLDTTIYPVVSNGQVSYYFTNDNAIPAADANSTGPQVILDIKPPDGVVPTTNSDGTPGSPLTVLPDSAGFDKTQLVVGLKDAPPGSPPDQQLGLGFFGSGLQKGGLVHFTLGLANATNPPVLDPVTPGIIPTAGSLHVPIAATTPTPAVTPTVVPVVVPTVTHTPEPMSLVLWSALAGFGAIRAHARARRPA